MATTLTFTEADIRRIADPRSFERGLGYLDAVGDLRIDSTQFTATVRGRSRYRVSLSFGGGRLAGDCSCPHGADGFFCKHCVAVGLAVLELGDELPERMAQARDERQALDSWLESLSKEELLAELRGLLAADSDLHRRFELRAASVNADAVAVRHAVRELIVLSSRDYIDHDEAYGYAANVSEAVTAIGTLIDAGAGAEAIGIAREAITLLADACEHIDDSSGWVGDAAHTLLQVHLRACMAAPPDPVSLGDYLADLLLHGDGDYGFGPDLDDYAGLLGDQGSATVREQIAAAYAADPQDWRAKSLMESMAKADGDVDAVIAIYAADLDDRGWNHLRIAQELDEAGRGDEALGWAERGVRDAAQPDYHLVDYLAGRYAADGRGDDVLSLRRERFQAERTLHSYQALRRAATDRGGWPAERAEALALLRGDLPRAGVRGAHVSWAWGGPVLVDVLLDDGDLDAAWSAAAGVASQAQWLRLADASTAARPADALAVYLKAIEPLRSQTGDQIYRQMAGLLLSIRACHEALGSVGEFRRYITALRADQKRKRNLMRILDESGL